MKKHDPLFLIKEEISIRQEDFRKGIDKIVLKKNSILQKIQQSEAQFAKAKEELLKVHNDEINEATSYYNDLKNETTLSFQSQTQQYSTFIEEQTKSEVSRTDSSIRYYQEQIKQIREAQNSTNNVFQEKYQILIAPFQDSIEIDKTKISNLQSQIEKLKNIKSIIQKHKTTQKIQNIKMEIQAVQNSLNKMKETHQQSIEKMEKDYQKKYELYSYQIQKLRNQVKEEHQYILSLKKSINNKKEEFAQSMFKLKNRMNKMKISLPKAPSESQMRQWKVNEFNTTILGDEIEEKLRYLRREYHSLKSENDEYRHKLRVLTFHLSGI